MEIRLKILSRDELNEATKLRRYLIPLHQGGYDQPVKYAILEQMVGKDSAEGAYWHPIEVSR